MSELKVGSIIVDEDYNVLNAGIIRQIDNDKIYVRWLQTGAMFLGRLDGYSVVGHLDHHEIIVDMYVKVYTDIFPELPLAYSFNAFLKELLTLHKINDNISLPLIFWLNNEKFGYIQISTLPTSVDFDSIAQFNIEWTIGKGGIHVIDNFLNFLSGCSKGIEQKVAIKYIRGLVHLVYRKYENLYGFVNAIEQGNERAILLYKLLQTQELPL